MAEAPTLTLSDVNTNGNDPSCSYAPYTQPTDVIKYSQERIRKSVSNGNFESLQSEIIENFVESLGDCNDNFFDKPISIDDTKSLIEILLYKLPSCCKAPEIFADPRGYIGLEWISERNDRLVIVPKSRKLIYAFSIGQLREHGEVSIYNGIPKLVTEKIKSHFS